MTNTETDNFANLGRELWEKHFPAWDAREFVADRAASAAADLLLRAPETTIGGNFIKFLQLRSYFRKLMEIEK